MLTLILGIIIGATFAEFWRHLYRLVKRKILTWMDDHKTNSSGQS